MPRIGNRKFCWPRFLKWLFIRIVFPLSPILISSLAEFFFRFGTFTFPDERLIVFSFLLPIIYLQEVNDAASRNALYFVSILCLVLYVFAVMANQPQIKTAFPKALYNICLVGGIAFCVEVFAAILYEVIRSFEEKKP
jgi:hypothetical protein